MIVLISLASNSAYNGLNLNYSTSKHLKKLLRGLWYAMAKDKEGLGNQYSPKTSIRVQLRVQITQIAITSFKLFMDAIL